MNNALRALLRIFAGLSLALLMSGCVSKILQSKVDEPRMYMLQAGTPTAVTVAYPVSVRVALPVTAPGLNTDHVVVLRNQNQLDHYAGARWAGSAAQVVQSLLIAQLQAQQGLKSVQADGIAGGSDYLLAIELRDFQAEYESPDAAPTVRVTLSGNLVNVQSRGIAGVLRGSAQIKAQANRLGDVISAFETASQQAGMQISAQVMTALSHPDKR